MVCTPSPWDYIKDSISDDDAFSDKTFLHWQSAGSRLFRKTELWGLMQRPALDDWYLRSPCVPICVRHISPKVHQHSSVSMSKHRITGQTLWPSVSRLPSSSNTTDVQKETKSWTPAFTHTYLGGDFPLTSVAFILNELCLLFIK